MLANLLDVGQQCSEPHAFAERIAECAAQSELGRKHSAIQFRRDSKFVVHIVPLQKRNGVSFFTPSPSLDAIGRETNGTPRPGRFLPSERARSNAKER
jgi:hypothetical protein